MPRRELPLPYMPIDPMIEDSERMGLYLERLGDCEHPDPEMVVVRFLLWVGRNRPDGRLGRLTPKMLARHCRWTEDPQQLWDAFTDTEDPWIGPDGDEWVLLNHGNHGGKVLEKREQYRERQDRSRRRRKCREAGHPSDTCECPGNVTGDTRVTSRGSHGGVTPLKGEGRRVKGEGDLCTTTGWADGEPIESVDHLQQAVSSWGLRIELTQDERSRAKQLYPIPEHEYREALTATRKQDRERPVSYLLSVVDGIRRRAIKHARAGPGPPPTSRPESRSAFRESYEDLMQGWASDGPEDIRQDDVQAKGLLPPAGK